MLKLHNIDRLKSTILHFVNKICPQSSNNL